MGSQVQTTRSVMNPMHCDDDEGMVVVEEDQHAAYRDPYEGAGATAPRVLPFSPIESRE